MQVQWGLGILLLIAACAARDLPSRSETVNDYETVYPRIIRSTRDTRSADGVDKEFIVVINAANETLTLHLKMNEKLIAPHFTSIHYDEDGKEIRTDGHANCYYQGEVEEHPTWIVVMNTCGGLNGFFGDMNNKSQYFKLAPVSRSNPSLEQAHMLVTDTEQASEAGTCGTVGHSDSSESITEHLESLAGDIERVRRQSPTGEYIVEMAIVNDNRQFNHHGRDLSATVQNAIDIVNAADVIYRTLRIRLVVVHVITWTSGDRINVVSDPNTLLGNTRVYKRTVTQPHDSLMLITGLDLTQNTVGIAFLNTMCGSASVGVVQDGPRSTSSSASTFAHELGHVFNLEHDTSGCSCNDPSGRCVMAAIAGFPAPERWSSCSVSQIQNSLTRTSNNLGRCLENEPTTTVADPVCGNGIREGDEICDCGSPEECDDPCCNVRTCQPAAGAQCTKGECCTSTCQFKDYGTTCRSASGQCDIQEYCSGESSECPADVYSQDGAACNNGQAYCFSGECQTYNDQCQYHFGTNMGVSNCYQSYNPQGSVFGNCGHTATAYIPCAQTDSMCGQLFCNPGQYQGRVSGVRVTIVTVGVFVSGQRRDCQAFTTEPGTDMMSPGLVSDGTKCSNGHLCFEQKCIPVTDVPGTTCPISNGQPCSGRGECNNRGQCSCNVGFIGRACETSSSGPSTNECATGQHNCDQGCVDTEESFFCTCNNGYKLASDGHSCITDCGGRLTTASGSFQTPGWPNNYPQENFQCEWIIELPSSASRIEFTVDDSSFGINGRDPCTNDHIQFFDGTTSNANSLLKLCGHFSAYNFEPITTFSSRARVVFTGSVNPSRPTSRVGVKVDYRTVTQQNECQVGNGGCDQICIDTTQSFECRCNTGYTLGSDGKSCNDVNECSQGTHNCAQRCTNTLGSFFCACNSGYRLASDRRTCNDVNECSDNSDNCAQRCTNTAGSYICSCNSGFTLAANGRSCTANPTTPPPTTPPPTTPPPTTPPPTTSPPDNGICGGRLTAASGSFQTPGWPTSYPQENLQCEWIIELPSSASTIEFTVDDSAFGINGRAPCTNDHIQFFDGTTSNANSLLKLCNVARNYDFKPITTTSSRARIVFTGSVNPNRPASRVGVKVNYKTVTQQDTDECQVGNGGCDQICIDTTQSYECRCNTGYTLGSDGKSCNDINECTVNNGGCQQNCFNFQGSFSCWCDAGYSRDANGRTCSDINECSEGSDNCAQRCTNTAGSYTCSCNSGFTLAADGRSCTANPTTPPPTTPPPTTSPPDNGVCGGRLTAASGSFQTPGWPNNYPQENLQCEWIIELPSSASTIEFTVDDSAFGINGRAPCTNDHIQFFDGTTSNANSLLKLCNVARNYDFKPITTTSSRARVVFTGSVNPNRPASRVGVKVNYKTVTQQDTDECQVGNGGCDQICIDTTQSYECRCNTGYTLASDGKSCNDINECTVNNGGCQQNCFNFQGSFACWCNAGYSRDANGRTCSDIDECSEGSDNCAQRCTNTAGSYTCSCNSGFTLAADGRSCTTNPTTPPPTTSPPDNGICGGRLTAASGSFQSPGWPNNYPQENLQCEWIIELPSSASRIEFTVDDSAFGINGRAPCTNDHIQFFDGTTSNANSLLKLCGVRRNYDFKPITTTSSRARIVFTGSVNPNRPASRVGVKVNYKTV